MSDDRPIKPDKKYLEQYIERISQVQKKDFLKKQADPLLPCFKHRHAQQRLPTTDRQDKRSKAELYEEIKRKNREKFGQKKPAQVQVQQLKKIKPKEMTIGYKPKQPVLIDTEQYKKKPGSAQRSKKTLSKDTEAKIEYEKLLEYYRKELSEFQQEKEQFNKVATKLKFKEMISKEQGLSYSKIKEQVERQLITQSLSIAGCTDIKHKVEESPKELHTAQQCSKSQPKQVHQLSKTFSVEDIKKCMDDATEKLKTMKDRLLNRQLSIRQHRYDISQIHLLPQFDPQTIYDFIDPQKLKYHGNDLYRLALQAFNSKFAKENEVHNHIQEVKTDHKINKDIRVKYIGQKRVMKYEGWTEVWIPGKQRLMANSSGEKVVWLGNGDVLQEFQNQISTYYSKAKDILKINYKQLPSIYYHSGLNQLWSCLPDSKREVIFGNGRKEIVEDKSYL